jgi:hypothetical protein
MVRLVRGKTARKEVMKIDKPKIHEQVEQVAMWCFEDGKLLSRSPAVGATGCETLFAHDWGAPVAWQGGALIPSPRTTASRDEVLRLGMQEMKYNELEDRASKSEMLDAIKNMEARSRVHDVIDQMKEEGKALVLSSEEENMLRSFRRFKLRMRKQGEVFTWQTRIPEGVDLVEDSGLVMHPSEVAR